jgi:GTP-binding protein Era
MDTIGAIRAVNSIRSTRVLTKSWDELRDYDLALFVIDGVKRVDIVAKESVKRLKAMKVLPKNIKLNAKDIEGKDLETELESMQSMLIVNKVDLVVNKKKMKEIVAEIEDIGNFNKTHYISALTGFGIEELMKDMKTYSYENSWNYNPNYVTPSSDAEVVHQIIKKALFDSSYKEIPYLVGVKIQSWVCMSNGEINIECDLLTNSKVQKAMLAGTNGRKAKAMATQCEAEIAAYLQRPVKLLLCIKQSKYKREGQEAPFYEEEP